MNDEFTERTHRVNTSEVPIEMINRITVEQCYASAKKGR